MKNIEKIWIITSIILFLTVIVSLFSVVVAVHLIGVSSGGEKIVEVITNDNTIDYVKYSTTPPNEDIETPAPMTYNESTKIEETKTPIENTEEDNINRDTAILKINYADDTSEVIICQRTSTAHEIMEYLYTFDNVMSISVFPAATYE